MSKVKIRYTDSALASKYGTGEIEVKRGLAEHLSSKGWAKIINSPPVANQSPTQQELDEIKKKYEDDTVLYMLEEELLTKTALISGEFVDLNLRKVGEKCGFKITMVNPTNFTPGKLILSNVIIVNAPLKGFNDVQLIQMSSVIFQKNVPYVLRISKELIFNEMHKHLIMDAKLNIFANNEIFEKTVEELGEIFADRWYIENGDHYKLWNQIDKAIQA